MPLIYLPGGTSDDKGERLQWLSETRDRAAYGQVETACHTYTDVVTHVGAEVSGWAGVYHKTNTEVCWAWCFSRFPIDLGPCIARKWRSGTQAVMASTVLN